MSLLVVGLSHRSAPVSVLERAALPADAQAKLLHDTVAAEPATEAAVLATCNRIELYADVDKFHAGVAELSTLLAQHSGVGLEELTPYLYVHYEDRAVHHLLSVACGLDSMVVGEGQILGQIKDALATAQELHTAGRLLNDLFQQALRVGKRAHSETGIDRAGQSLVTFGLEQLADGAPVDEWAAGKRALVIGAGSMSSLAAATLARVGVAEIAVANRTRARAERLVEILSESGTGCSARVASMDSVEAELTRVDVVVSCTGATGLVLTGEAVAAAVASVAGPERAEAPSLRAPDGSLVARLAAAAARDGRIPDAGSFADAPGVDSPELHGTWAGNGAVLDNPATGPESSSACPAPGAVPTLPQALDSSPSLRPGGAPRAGGTPIAPGGPAAHSGSGSGTADGEAVRAVIPAQHAPAKLALLDLAMPRDIDAAVHRIDGVRLVDIESLAEASADAPMAADVDQVRAIVADEVAAFGAAQRAAHITPTVVALRTMAADVVQSELARLRGRLPDLDERQQAEMTQTVRRVVDKLLHAPTVRVKQLASEPGGSEYADALRTLFDLDPQTVASVSRADSNSNDTDARNRGRA
ncbi:glutamyl-tRNA reductase [Streptomyces luteolus]|uniref:Glutamyl-tRNA reductase n=1 Tax=Streptomyces luteolus TaxID=3043615 RepID=A0ABT6TA55_9ACTN|nr:glutamyl-tRNA reductase [Streptomyces sp. B-S-A12]MDI3423909.1 glutamyl-tRNA reductase [Streptomyces sp. B-S-A12]